MLVIVNGNVTRSRLFKNEDVESNENDRDGGNPVAEAAEALGLPKRSIKEDVLAEVEDRR